MGRRYYCDFCDKSFADNPTHRKNHLKGVHHQRNKKAHYDSFRSPEIILNEELSRRPCKNFLSSGSCNFMENCKFSHLTEERKKQLEKMVEEKKRTQNNLDTEEIDPEKYVSEWLTKRNKKLKKEEQVPEALPTYEIPPHVSQIPNPPLSILPPPPDVFIGLIPEEWG